jgi:hypothetical protein
MHYQLHINAVFGQITVACQWDVVDVHDWGKADIVDESLGVSLAMLL